MKNKILFSTLLILSFIEIKATEYSAQIQPYIKYIYKSDVSGKITFVDIEKEKKIYDKKKLIIKVDNKKEQIELRSLVKTKKNYKDMIKSEKNILKATVLSKNKSILEKNKEKINFLTLKNTYNDITAKIETLYDTLNRKKIYIKKGIFLNKIFVREGEYITPGSPLFEAFDISKQKIIVNVKVNDIYNIKEKEIFIDGMVSKDFYINKISKVEDENKLGTYEVELISNGDETNKTYKFGEVISIEFITKEEAVKIMGK